MFKYDRPESDISHFSFGPHACFGREIALSYVTGLIKIIAGLKNLRPAPGTMGLLKWIQVGTERCYLSDNWSYLTFDPTSKFTLLLPRRTFQSFISYQSRAMISNTPPTAWKLHFDGTGKGVHHPPANASPQGSLPKAESSLIQVENVLRQQRREVMVEVEKMEYVMEMDKSEDLRALGESVMRRFETSSSTTEYSSNSHQVTGKTRSGAW